jgi:hypothetical protein
LRLARLLLPRLAEVLARLPGVAHAALLRLAMEVLARLALPRGALSGLGLLLLAEALAGLAFLPERVLRLARRLLLGLAIFALARLARLAHAALLRRVELSFAALLGARLLLVLGLAQIVLAALVAVFTIFHDHYSSMSGSREQNQAVGLAVPPAPAAMRRTTMDATNGIACAKKPPGRTPAADLALRGEKSAKA